MSKRFTIPVTITVITPMSTEVYHDKVDVLRSAFYHIAHDNLDDLWESGDSEQEDDPIRVEVGPATEGSDG